MRLQIWSMVLPLAIGGLVTAFGSSALLAQSTARVSVDSQGRQGNGASEFTAISADGRFVAFASVADNLVPGDTNGVEDFFVCDRQTGATIRVSVDSQGVQADRDSYYRPAISADGRYVAFMSAADNLVPGDTNHREDIFVHDCLTGETTRASVDSQGNEANDLSFFPAISADGRYVAFASAASNLVADDRNGVMDILVHDRQTGQTVLASVDSQGVQGNGMSNAPVISADGRLVAFESVANNLVPGDTNTGVDIFVHDFLNSDTTRVNVDSQGNEANSDYSFAPAISADGRFVGFDSEATNLVPNDGNGSRDVFVHDRQTGETTRVSVDSSGAEANSMSFHGGISADGRFVAFCSYASNLVPGDTNYEADVFMHDRQTGETTRASVGFTGTQGNGVSWSEPGASFISGDGRFVAFSSGASNMVLGDTNGSGDVFVRDRNGPCSSPATWTNYGSGWAGTNGVPGLVAISNPVLCAPFEMFASNSLGLETSGVLLTGFSNATLGTPWGGVVLLVPALVMALRVPAAGLDVVATLPCDDSLCGLIVFTQLVEMDPGAVHGISFTPGLELRLGQ
ncbi:MAG: calcium-binding protein [Planctomycetota bacterium]